MGGDELIVVSIASPRVEARLTESEGEVAKLVAAGLSNAEIAAARRRSERTVANQVASVLEKLGAASRHQVARVVGLETRAPLALGN
jgi:DNA-binding NarL/FixJ family response regulator